MDKQYLIVGDEPHTANRSTVPAGRGERKPKKLYNYDAFVAKFKTANTKTTDDCYTPHDVFDVVLEWLDEKVGLDGRQIVRPFYPGGDYENEAYPDGCVVVDNPPFSIFLKIVRFYTTRNIPFFLFGPAVTMMNATKLCSVIMTYNTIIFENGAKVNIGFASNLFGDIVAMSAPRLGDLITACDSQKQQSKKKQQYRIPNEVITFSKLQTIAKGGGSFCLRRCDVAAVIDDLDLHPKEMFGTALLVSRAKAEEARAKAEEARAIQVELSDRERRLVERLEGIETV